MRVETDGRPPDARRLSALLLAGYGHFTAMQVRAGRVRGLDLHLARLDRASRELFGTGLPGERVRAHIRHALDDGVRDASVRVYVQWPDGDAEPAVTVIVREPGGMPGSELRLRSVPYQRSVAHIKHLGDFGQSYYARLVARDGFDEALLTGPDGIISEGATTNVGFFDVGDIVWPAAPMLAGITMQLLQAGLTSRSAPVRLADVDQFTGAFVTNSRGIAAVREIDGHPVPVDAGMMARLAAVYEAAPWDPI